MMKKVYLVKGKDHPLLEIANKTVKVGYCSVTKKDIYVIEVDTRKFH